MDDRSFDDLARAATGGGSRRAALGLALGGLLGARAFGDAAAKKKGNGNGQGGKGNGEKCETCPTCPTCPKARYCCQCRNGSTNYVACQLVEASNDGEAALKCGTFCASAGVAYNIVDTNNPTPGEANFCGTDKRCVSVKCPLPA